MTILAQLYVNGGRVAILDTLELASPRWGAPIVLVRDYVNHVITTEDGRILTAYASGMAVALPERSGTAAQKLRFAIDGVRPEATRLLREAERYQDPISLTYRCYTSDDLSEPAEPPYHLIVRSFQASADHVEVVAGLFDLIDMRWPRDLYNSINTPGLRYMQG